MLPVSSNGSLERLLAQGMPGKLARIHANSSRVLRASPWQAASCDKLPRGEPAGFAGGAPSREGFARPSEASGEAEAVGAEGGANPLRVPM